MPDDITVRSATTEDTDLLTRFNAEMAKETENKTLDLETVRAGVRAMLENPSRGFYLVAVQAEMIVGSLMITTEWSDWRNAVFWWIQSVYVRPGARRSGVYTALHETVRERASDNDDVCGLRLYVEEDNEPARKTYEALGMSASSYRMYEEML